MDIDHLHQELIREVSRRLLGESLPRLRKCLDLLPEAMWWERPNAQSNSLGNLVLHLCGNARQWWGAGLRGWADVRQRDTEFAENGPLPREILLEMLASTEMLIAETLQLLQPADLLKRYVVQGFDESGVAILIHVTEHFAYHVGQVT